MAKSSAWTKKRKDVQGENYSAARTAEQKRIDAHPHKQNVAPGAHNGHSIGGYSIRKHGREQAEKLAALHSRPGRTRRSARATLKSTRQAVTA